MSPRNSHSESGMHTSKGVQSAKADVSARTTAAVERAVEVHDRVRVAADRICREIDEMTMPGVPITISDEDSVVTTLEAVIAEHAEHKAAGNG